MTMTEKYWRKELVDRIREFFEKIENSRRSGVCCDINNLDVVLDCILPMNYQELKELLEDGPPFIFVVLWMKL